VALQTLLAADPVPDVVIVDYNMPGMNGAQFISRYSTTVSGTPRVQATQVLLMSGLPPSHFQDFMSEFAELKLGVLEKPFTLDTLRKRLASIQVSRQKNGAASGNGAAALTATDGMVARTTPLIRPDEPRANGTESKAAV
jgi:CheY-like chemotaxis protein